MGKIYGLSAILAQCKLDQTNDHASACAQLSIEKVLASYSRTHVLKNSSIDWYPNNLGIQYFGLIPHEYLNPKTKKENYSDIAKQFKTR